MLLQVTSQIVFKSALLAELALLGRELWAQHSRDAQALLVLRATEASVGVLALGLLLSFLLLVVAFGVRSSFSSIIGNGGIADGFRCGFDQISGFCKLSVILYSES